MTTYCLTKWEGGNSISKTACTLQAQTLTYCEISKVETASARQPVLCKPNHLHPVRLQRWKQQQGSLHIASPTSYTL
jgi:hypothetical protein